MSNVCARVCRKVRRPTGVKNCHRYASRLETFGKTCSRTKPGPGNPADGLVRGNLDVASPASVVQMVTECPCAASASVMERVSRGMPPYAHVSGEYGVTCRMRSDDEGTGK
jgi:hypothetical protein